MMPALNNKNHYWRILYHLLCKNYRRHQTIWRLHKCKVRYFRHFDARDCLYMFFYRNKIPERLRVRTDIEHINLRFDLFVSYSKGEHRDKRLHTNCCLKQYSRSIYSFPYTFPLQGRFRRKFWNRQYRKHRNRFWSYRNKHIPDTDSHGLPDRIPCSICAYRRNRLCSCMCRKNSLSHYSTAYSPLRSCSPTDDSRHCMTTPSLWLS